MINSFKTFIFNVFRPGDWDGPSLLVPEDPYKCFEHDNPPVDTSATFYDGYCKDNLGIKYKPIGPKDPAQLTSCCECLE